MKDEDKAAIVQFLLKNYYIQENEALQQEVNYYQVVLFDKNRELVEAGQLLNESNHRIRSMQSDILYYQRLIAHLRNNEWIPVSAAAMRKENRKG